MKNKRPSFSLTIGSLTFNTKSLGIILFAIFLMGILAGLYSMIQINNLTVSQAITIPFFLGFFISALILIKGIRETERLEDPTVK